MKQYIKMLIEGMCFGVVFVILKELKDIINLNISDKEVIIWSLVLWVVIILIIRSVMDKFSNKEENEHMNMN